MQKRMLGWLVVAVLVGLFGCGGEEADAASTTPAPTGADEPPAGNGAGGGRASADDFDPNSPDYQGDHSIPGNVEAGATVYNANCVACHSADGRGNGGVTGGNLRENRRHLGKNNEALLRSIREGRPNASPAMPAYGEILSQQEMVDALSYVRATYGQPAAATP
jgi:mono/diheme cytochrome c family protein